MFDKKFGSLLATTLSLLALAASAQDATRIATSSSQHKTTKPVSAESYYASVKLNAAKAYSESIEFQKQGKLIEAGLALKKCLAIREYFVATDREIPALQLKLAEIWLSAGKNDAAIEVLSEALAGFSRWCGPGSEQLIKPLTLLGDLHMEQSDYTQALNSYNHAYVITQRLKGPASLESMKLRLILAGINKSAKLPEKAASLYSLCFEHQKKNEKLMDRQQLYLALQDYAVVLKELKKEDEAKAILDRANEIRTPATQEGTVEPGIDEVQSNGTPTTAK